MVRLGAIVMILDLHRQGLSVSAIAARTGFDRKTVRKRIERGLVAPAYSPRAPQPKPRLHLEIALSLEIVQQSCLFRNDGGGW